MADSDHTVAMHRRLLGMFREYEDTMFRLSQSPDRARHRGLEYCQATLTATASLDRRATWLPSRAVTVTATTTTPINFASTWAG